MKRSLRLLSLLLCLLPGMMPEAKAETVRTTCYFCKEYVVHKITGYERYNDWQHWVFYNCSSCGSENKYIPLNDPLGYHSGGTETPTCTTGKTCAKCGAKYDVLGHDWGAWQSRGNNSEHIRHCQREGCDAVDTERCSGDSSDSCTTGSSSAIRIRGYIDIKPPQFSQLYIYYIHIFRSFQPFME